MSQRQNVSELPGVERLLALTDGVVAIALTLLVLQLHVPKLGNPTSASELASKLGSQSAEFTAYLVSFYVIAQFWLAHHRSFRHVAGHDEGIAWVNFAFLFTISIMPFASDILGTWAENPLAVDIFSLNMLLASLATLAVAVVGKRRHLLLPSTRRRDLVASRTRSLGVMAVFGLSMVVAWVSTDAAKYMWIAVVAVPTIAARVSERAGDDDLAGIPPSSQSR